MDKIILNRTVQPYNMAKELGQIHSVNTTKLLITDVSARHRIDLPGELSQQLQRMVRQGCYFKLAGIDLSLSPDVAGDGGAISGKFRYYAPTKGRCAAYRNAFRAMANQMKIQGISMRDNHLYDFRVALTNDTSGLIAPLRNQATLDGVTGLAMNDVVTPGASVFGIWNESVEPVYTGTADGQFKEGFDTLLQLATGTDFVLNDSILYSGDEDYASTQYEEIPFEISWDTTGTTTTVFSFNWRPDPALYIAVLAGQLEMILDSVETDSTAPNLSLEMNFMVAGWKSIMGNPDKKKTSRKRMSRK